MKVWVISGTLAGMLLGLWIGRAIPQGDLRKARNEIARLKEAGNQRPAAARSAMAGVESMLKVRREDVAEARRARRASAATNSASSSSSSAAAAAPATTNQPHATSMSNELARVRQAWDLRREIARKNFIEKAKLDDAQTADFNVLIEAMNLRLGTAIDRWADRIRKDKVFTAETGARMMSELSSAVVLTYDELDRKLPADWRDRAGPRFELVRFIDPEVMTPFQDLEDVMSRADFGSPDLPEPAAPVVTP